MTLEIQAINALVLVDNPAQARKIARQLAAVGGTVQQSWVSSHAEFGAALRRDEFDLGILYCNASDQIVPAAIHRHPDTPFLAILDQYRNRKAEDLIDLGLTDIVGFSHPVRMARVLKRMLAEARIRLNYKQLLVRQQSQLTMLEALLHSSEDAVAYIHQGMHSFSNDAYQTLTGLPSSDAVLGTPLLDIIVQDTHRTVLQHLRRFEDGLSTPTHINTRMRHVKGHNIPVTLELSRSWYDEEVVIQLVARERPSSESIDKNELPVHLVDQTLKLSDGDLTQRIH